MIDPRHTLGVILAGGQGRRMNGHDKALIDLHGRSLIGHVIDRLEPQVGALVISANGNRGRFAQFDLPVIADRETDPASIGAGPLAGVLAGLLHARRHHTETTHVATAATDTPFLPADLVARLGSAATKPNTIAMAASAGRLHPVFALWPVALADDLGMWLADGENRKVTDWATRHRVIQVPFDTDDGDPFFNINTPQDLDEARKHAIPEYA